MTKKKKKKKGNKHKVKSVYLRQKGDPGPLLWQNSPWRRTEPERPAADRWAASSSAAAAAEPAGAEAAATAAPPVGTNTRWGKNKKTTTFKHPKSRPDVGGNYSFISLTFCLKKPPKFLLLVE